MKRSLLTLGGCLLISWSAMAEDYLSIKEGLSSAEKEVATAAVDSCVTEGKAIIPSLQKWAGDEDPRLKARARHALGKITGQWGSQTKVVWKRSVKEAINEDKPLLVLHLFGKLDEEYC
ncbi:hypothetical protein [Rubritalea squalenifaciens]|uniref:hypothetical protein n=1 Tax=Rubritalea squalenifaciens TaxID=407226 RepID=UPI001160389A|nr:hypothetical protein [Rubritalea squalenifaciens]